MKTLDMTVFSMKGGGNRTLECAEALCSWYKDTTLERLFKKHFARLFNKRTTFFRSFFIRNAFHIGNTSNGFTLAEVLITLGIIGVVAAMTLPALINNTRNLQYKAGLQKAYSVLAQALERMNSEQGFIANQENYGMHQFAPALKKYLIQGKDCGNTNCQQNGTNDDVGLLLSKVYKTYNGYKGYNANFDEGQSILLDGMFLMIDNDGSNPICISVDINGYYKKPNRFGHDVFMFQIDNKTGKLIPMGTPGYRYPQNMYCSTTSKDSRNGFGCTLKALTDDNYFKNLPK